MNARGVAALVAMLGLACAAAVQAQAPAAVPAQGPAPSNDPPLNISADNITGSHGEQGDEVLLNGNLRVTRGRSVLTANAGRYLRTTGMLFLDGLVRMVDSTTVLTCDHAAYSESDDILTVDGNVVVVDKEAELRAPHGRYNRRTGQAELEGGVVAKDKFQRLLADRATYDRDSALVRARGHCRGFDDDNKLELDADAIDYSRTSHWAVATGDPVLRSRDGDDRVTEVRALTLRLNTDSRIAEAIDSVSVARDTLRGRADYGLFDDRQQRGWLYGRPRVWDDQTAVSGDTLQLFAEKRVLKRVAVLGDAVMVYTGVKPGVAGEASRLTGHRADLWFTKDAIDSLVAIGDAQNTYQGVPVAGKTSERNATSGDTITVFFKDKKIDQARVQGGARGEYHMAVDIADTNAAKREVVSYEGTRITFQVPKSTIVLDQGATLRYRDTQLNARRVEYNVDQATLVAEGNPEILEKGDKVGGNLMTYDMNARVGTIYQAETSFERGLYHGERIRKAGEKELDVLHGEYSTCDLDEPHYHFSAKYMKIFLNDKLIAKPVVFYVKHVPLLALPFWVFPVKSGRHSGFLFPQFELGFNEASGRFIRNAGYYWAPNDYMDYTLSGDYYSAEPSWVLRAEGVYKLLYVLDGNFRGTYARNENPLARSENYDFTANHTQEITPRTRAVARAAFVSSKEYSSSNLFGRPLGQRLNRLLTSGLALTHNAEWASFNAVFDRRQDLDADASLADPDGAGPAPPPPIGSTASLASITQTLPNLSIALPTRTLGSLPGLNGTPLGRSLQSTYFSLNSLYQSFHEERGVIVDSAGTIGTNVTNRSGFSTTMSLSDARRVGGWWNIAPRADAEVVVFDHDVLGNDFASAGVWNAGVTSSTSLYGTFRPDLGPLYGLRHILTPSVNYFFSPEFEGLLVVDSTGRTRPRFESFGSIGISGAEQSFMSFGLDQRLQVKLKHGEKFSRLDNLVALSTRGAYNFLWREQGQLHPFTPLAWAMTVQPPSYLSFSSGWTTDFYQDRPLRNFSYNFGLSFSSNALKRSLATPELTLQESASPGGSDVFFPEDWSVGIAYSYSGARSLDDWVSTKTANFVSRFQLSPKWGIEYSTTADLNRKELQVQRFGITRDLHCWTAGFSRQFIRGGEAEYYFRLAVKDQRELYYERGTRTGSIGGIQ